jgi:AcrR family transcriptional regulator
MSAPGSARHRRRQLILDAASELFAARDYTAVSMEDVAARARVARGTVYNHFGTKQRLYQQVLTTRFAELLVGRVGRVLRQGIRAGAFREVDPDSTSYAILGAVAGMAEAVAGSCADDRAVRRAAEDLHALIGASLTRPQEAL